jgi:hypothetical protein
MKARAAAALFACAVACHGTPAGDETTAAPPPAATHEAPPVDHLAPGELLEGPATAFGVHLPAVMHVDATFADVVYASGPAKLHPLVTYFQARLQGGDLREGESSASFDHVSALARPGRSLRVHITNATVGTHVEIQDVTPLPAPELPDETARWKRVGALPNGALADPTHLE